MIGFQSNAFQLDAVQVPAGATGDVDYTLEFDSGSYSVSGAQWELFYSRTQTDAGTNKKRRTYVHKDRRFRGLTEAEIEEILADEFVQNIKQEAQVRKPIKIKQTATRKVQVDDDEDILLLL